MDIYKNASVLKLRINTKVGPLSTEQLRDLKKEDLDELAVKLDKEYKSSGKKSFLVKKSSKDKITKLKFDIVIDILNDKVEEEEKENNAENIKAHNAEIDDLIFEKKKEELKGKSIEDLKKMRK